MLTWFLSYLFATVNKLFVKRNMTIYVLLTDSTKMPIQEKLATPLHFCRIPSK